MKIKLLLLIFIVCFTHNSFGQLSDTGALRTYINNNIVTNGTRSITAANLNTILNGVVKFLTPYSVSVSDTSGKWVGSLYRKPGSDSVFYVKGSTVYFAFKDTSLSGGGGVWGSITGTLSSQSDLNSALNGKQATLVSGTNLKTINSSSLLGSGNLSVGTLVGSDTTNKWVTTLIISNDSFYYVKNGTETYLFKIGLDSSLIKTVSSARSDSSAIMTSVNGKTLSNVLAAGNSAYPYSITGAGYFNLLNGTQLNPGNLYLTTNTGWNGIINTTNLTHNETLQIPNNNRTDTIATLVDIRNNSGTTYTNGYAINLTGTTFSADTSKLLQKIDSNLFITPNYFSLHTPIAFYLGTTSIPLNRSSGSQSLTGISIDGTAANITATSNSTLTTLSALSLPTTQLSGTITNAQLAGSIASSKFVGTDITTIGTIGTGTWQGTTIGSGYGGTGFSTYTKGDIFYSSATNTLSKLGIGSTGQLLSISGGVPAWTSNNAWTVTGNSGMAYGTNYFGTNDNQCIYIYTNGVKRGNFDSASSTLNLGYYNATTPYLSIQGSGGGGNIKALTTNNIGLSNYTNTWVNLSGNTLAMSAGTGSSNGIQFSIGVVGSLIESITEYQNTSKAICSNLVYAGGAAPAVKKILWAGGDITYPGGSSAADLLVFAGKETNSGAQGNLYLATDTLGQRGNVSIGDTSHALPASAILTIKSTSQGVLLPRMTTTQANAISSPATGLLLYNTTTNSFWFNNGTSFHDMGGSNHQVFTPSTGGSITVSTSQNNIINPAGSLSTLTITFPSSPNNNDEVTLTFEQAIATVTYAGGTINGQLTSPVIGSQKKYIYDAATTTWY